MQSVTENKCIIILKSGLPLGLAANAAAVLAISLGHKNPQIIGEDLVDGSGGVHAGLVNVPVPLLQAEEARIKEIHDKAKQAAEISVIGFSEPARAARSFKDYREALGKTSDTDLRYVGVALVGEKSRVSELTSGLSLLR